MQQLLFIRGQQKKKLQLRDRVGLPLVNPHPLVTSVVPGWTLSGDPVNATGLIKSEIKKQSWRIMVF